MLVSLLVAGALDTGALPAVTGSYSVGRVTVEWTDRSRMEPLDPDHGYRTLAVDIWYPAEASSGPPAPYLDVGAFERAIGNAGTRRQLAPAYDVIKDGRALTHAVVNAPFIHSIGRAPVLIFSPGGGMVREVYAAQLSDLASHGFIVAAITHPYDGIVSIYRDGHIVKYDAKRWPQIPSIEGEWNLNQLDWHARDIRFVLDQLSQSKDGLPFGGHLDMHHVGTFGHSFGGVAAAQACQTDARFSACLNEDGMAAWRPFNVNSGAWRAKQRFMLIFRDVPPGPPPAEFAERADILERARDELKLLKRDHEIAMKTVSGGAYEVGLRAAGTSHADFSDLPVLGAMTSTEADARAAVLATIRSLTLAFFEQTLEGKRSVVLEGKSHGEIVQSIHRFN
jgi:platelet-activating factor acetylhydrolase isoform II